MIKEILAYQKEDENLRKIELELSGNENRKIAVSAKRYLDGVVDSINQLDDLSIGLQAEFENALNEEKKLKEQQEEFAHAIQNVSDQTGASYLIKKIEELMGKIKNLSAQVQKISNKIQETVKEYAVIKQKTKSAQDQYVESGKKYNDFKASKQCAKSEIENKLSELEKKVDPKIMEVYKKKRANKMFPIVFKVNGNVCGGCNMELSMSEVNKLKNEKIIEHECGKLVYLEED